MLIYFRCFCFVLFSTTHFIVYGCACETGGYEGANPYNKEEISKIAPTMEEKFYDEMTGVFNKIRNIYIMWNFKDHFYKLTGEQAKHLCKCIYLEITKDYRFTDNKEDAVFKDFNSKFKIKKSSNESSQVNPEEVKVTLIDCYINKLAFTLVEGYKARFCRNCYDVYVKLYDSLNQSGVEEERPLRKLDVDTPFKIIGKVNSVDFNTL